MWKIRSQITRHKTVRSIAYVAANNEEEQSYFEKGISHLCKENLQIFSE